MRNDEYNALFFNSQPFSCRPENGSRKAPLPKNSSKLPPFTCAVCGKTFNATGITTKHYTLLGGRKFCPKCAENRFRRRPPTDACAQAVAADPDALG